MRLHYLIFPSQERWRLWEGHSLFDKAKYLHSQVVSHLPSGAAHLDLGCGDGEILQVFQPCCAGQLGLDLDIERLKRCHTLGLRVIKADLRNNLPIADNRVDIVTLISILEHVEEPERLVREMARVLTLSGVIVVQIPNPRFIIDLHYFLPFYGWVPMWLRDVYRRLLKGEQTGITYYTNSIGRKDILALFGDFDIVFARGFFYPKEVAPYWARPFYGFFVTTGLARIMPTGYLFVFRKRSF
jgi:SAM-dependent methyltransferase